MATFEQLIEQPVLDMNAISASLDALDPWARLVAVRSVGRREMGRLFEAAARHRAIGLDDLVPPAIPPLTEVVHQGLNALPAFRTFAKPLCRPEPGAAELWGYNRQEVELVQVAAGPGYFVAYPDQPGEVLIDYKRLPPRTIAGWPPIISNRARLGLFVWSGMQDVLRGLSEHVTIGRARRWGRWSDNWFILCRQD